MPTEYPDLSGKIEKDLSLLEKALDTTRQCLKKTLEIVDSREKTMEKKMGFFERHVELAVSDPKEAEALWTQKKLGVSQNRIEAARKQAVQLREKIGRMEARRKDLEADQVRLSDFSPLKQQIENPVVKREFILGPDRQRKPNCKFSTFEHLFTPLAYRLNPKEDGVSWDKLSVEHCIADPQLIPDAFVEEMGLAELPLDLTEFQRLRLKADAISKLKRLFRESEPMKRYSKGGGPIPNPRLLMVRRFGPEQDGKILHTHFRGENDDANDRKILQVFDSAYTAYRKTLHVDRRYDREASLILQTEERIRDLNRRLASIRKGDPDAETLKEGIRQSLAKEAEALAASRNHFKHSAAEALASVADLRDSRGRENPAAACARLLKVIRFVKSRTPEIFNKSQFGAEDKQSLKEAIDRSEAIFGQLIATLSRVGSHLETPKRMPADPKENRALIARQRAFVFGQLMKPLETLTPIRPFKLYSSFLFSRFQKLLSASTNHNRAQMMKAVREALDALKVFVLQAHVERLLAEVSVPKDLNNEALRRMATKAKGVLQSNLSAAEPLIALATEKMIAQTFDELVSALDCDYPDAEDPEAEKRRQLRAILEKIDFEQILKTLG